MAARIVLVPQGTKILHHQSTQVLHVYDNGEILINTNASAEESELNLETPVRRGVQLPEAEHAQLEFARDRINTLNPTDIISAYIELIGPIDTGWLQTLKHLGLELLQFRPENSYLCKGAVSSLQQAMIQPFVLNVLPLIDSLKPRTNLSETGEQTIWVIVQGTREQSSQILRELASLPDVRIDLNQELDQVDFYLRIRAIVSAEGQTNLLNYTGVLAVEPYQAPQTEDEVAGLILAGQYDATGKPQGSYLHWLEEYGLNGDGVTIGVVDAGIDSAHPAFRDPSNPSGASRILDLSDGRKSWHGTFVAGHAAGCYLQEKDENQFIYGLGMAPNANLLIQDNQRSPSALCKETVSTKAPSGIPGSVQNNSWGTGTANPMTYGSQEATYDKLVRNADSDSAIPKPLTICFSAGNSGSAGLTRPKAAKNILITGNSETYRPGIGKDQSDNINEVYTGPHGSSQGNCGDGRIVPHIVAPGEWTASANYDSHPGDKEFISPNLTWGGGTSGASPKTAGACALLTQWWRRHNKGQSPSPAMLKALIVNGAEPMQSAGFIPNNLQGWGRLNLQNILSEDTQHVYVDQSFLLTKRGEQKTWSIRVCDPRKSVKVTLVWTDPPGSLNSGTAKISAIVNKLALRINVNEKFYRGNQFQNGWSYSDGTLEREGWDNIQNVYLQTGTSTGILQISVAALEITTNCLTGQIDTPQQDFALVITNGCLDTGATPAVVVVGVDKSNNSKPQQSTDYWKSGQRNLPKQTSQSDLDELNAPWWQSVQDRVSPSPAKPKDPVADADAWWLQDDVVWSKPEAERQSPLINHLSETLKAGVDAVTTGSGHHVLAESSQDSLSETLAHVMTQWEKTQSTERFAAVLVVGSGTRITPDDLATLRQIAFLGQLYLVSEQAEILAFLAQRIYRRSRVELRLAEDAQSLPSLVQDTIVEASGGQQLEISQTSEVSNGMVETLCVFDVVANDRHLALRFQYLPNQPPGIDLTRPGQVPVTVSAGIEIAGITITSGNGTLQLDLDASDLNWAGQWQIRVKQAGQRPMSRIRAWAWGALAFQVRQQPMLNQSETDRAQTESLVTLIGTEGTTLRRLQSQPRVIRTTAIATEAVRDIDITVEASRLERMERSEEADREIRTPAIAALISIPHTPEGAVVLDLPIRAEGADVNGNRFTRFLRQTLIQLEPRSTWRQRLETSEIMIFTTAQVIFVQYDNGDVIGLQLQKNDRQRYIKVSSQILRQQLEQLSLDEWKTEEFVFGILNQELYGLYRSLKS